MKYFVILLVFSNAVSIVLIASACDIDEVQNTIDNPYFDSCMRCVPNSWPHLAKEAGIERTHLSPLKMYFIAIYWASCLVTGYSSPHIYARTVGENIISLFTLLLGVYFTYHFCVQIISNGTDGYTDLQLYQVKVKTLLDYLYARKVPKYIIKLVKLHVYQDWKLSHGTTLKSIIHRYPRPLRTDIMIHIYFNSLSLNVYLAIACYPFYENLFAYSTTRMFVRNTNILLNGDVISDVYFIIAGTVIVFNETDEITHYIGPGSVFGAINKCKHTLIEYSVVAETTVQTLAIPSLILYNKVLIEEPKIQEVFTNKHFSRLYVPVSRATAGIALNINHEDEKLFKYRFKRKQARELSKHFDTIFRMLLFLPRSVIKYWKIEMVFLCWTSCMIYLYTCATGDSRISLVVLFYIIDLLLSINILVMLCKVKAKRLYTSLKGFLTGTGGVLLNVIMIIPLEIIFYPIFGINKYTFIMRGNRLIGLLYIIKYWKITCTQARNDPLPSNASKKCAYFLFLSMSLGVTASSAILYILNEWERDFLYSNLSNDSKSLLFLRCAAKVLGMRATEAKDEPNTRPIHLVKFAVYTILVLSRTIFYTSVFTLFYVKIFDKRATYPKYWHHYKKLMAFLKDEKTTSSLLHSAKRYMELHWTERKGEYVPELIHVLPYHLQGAIINYSYGKYLYFNELFNGCSLNFLRQVAACVKTIILYSGDVIVAAGSCEKCMYYIKSGVVVVNDKNINCTVDILYKWDSFGLNQGLNYGRHEYEYIAYSRVHLLCLHYKDWEYMIPFYKADFHLLKQNLKAINENDY